MPRQSRSSRPAPRSTPAVQSRGAATMAAPPVAASRPMAPPATAAHPPAATSSGPGMLGQMAATAGSVAIGSTIGHGLSNMLFGSSSTSGGQAEPVQTQQQPLGSQCDFQVKEFTKCLETSDVNGCNWFLEQLKACQATYGPRP